MANLRVYPNNGIYGIVTPQAGGGQAEAGQLYPGYNIIANPQSDGDSVQLPDAISGTVVIGFIAGGQSGSIGVYAKNGTSDTIYAENNGAMFIFNAGPQTIGLLLIAACLEDSIWCINCPVD